MYYTLLLDGMLELASNFWFCTHGTDVASSFGVTRRLCVVDQCRMGKGSLHDLRTFACSFRKNARVPERFVAPI